MANSNSEHHASTPAESGATATQPPFTGHHDHSFTLQVVMELQRSTGQLTEAVQTLKSTVDRLDIKLDRLNEIQCSRIDSLGISISNIKKTLYATGVVLTLLLAVGGFIVDKSWDLVVDQIKPRVEEAIKK
jgi:hypothetical protein